MNIKDYTPVIQRNTGKKKVQNQKSKGLKEKKTVEVKIKHVHFIRVLL